jgi:Tfp pilus assembly protein PilE
MIKKRGLTLIETIIYIALFSILIGGTFVTSFQIIESTDKVNKKTYTQEEGNFVLRKINWAFTGTTTAVTAINTPNASTPFASSFSIVRAGSPSAIDITFDNASSTILLREGGPGHPYLRLTSDNVKATSLGFQYIKSSGGTPAGLVASTTIDGIVFTTRKYVRK